MSTVTVVLREILLKGTASTQSEIKEALENQGFSCSQPKVSRLLNQIGAVKVVDNKGKTIYRLPHEAGLIHELSTLPEHTLLPHWVLSIVNNGALIIVHTIPGAAQMFARLIDQHKESINVMGTLAGDDTIFVAPKAINEITHTQQLITELFNL